MLDTGLLFLDESEIFLNENLKSLIMIPNERTTKITWMEDISSENRDHKNKNPHPKLYQPVVCRLYHSTLSFYQIEP